MKQEGRGRAQPLKGQHNYRMGFPGGSDGK